MLLIEYCNCCEQRNFNGAPQNHYGDPGGVIYRENLWLLYNQQHSHMQCTFRCCVVDYIKTTVTSNIPVYESSERWRQTCSVCQVQSES